MKKRANIINISMGIFIREGIHPTTMSKIAEDCDISLRSLYYYYSTKEDLAIDIQINCMYQIVKSYNLVEIKETQTGYEQVCHFLDNIVCLINDYKREMKYITAFDYHFHNSYPNEKYQNFLKEFVMVNTMYTSIRKGHKDGSINIIGGDPIEFGNTIYQSLFSYAQKLIYREKAMLSENLANRGKLEIFIETIKTAIKKS
jgi:hypothetical protein